MTDDTTPISDPETREFADRLRAMESEQNLGMAMVAGCLAAAVGSALWAAITLVTEFQIGWMAVGVGLLVGLTVRFFGRGLEPSYSVIGAVTALLGCVGGNVLSIIGFAAREEGMGFFAFFYQVDVVAVLKVFPSTMEPMDVLFYGIAIYEGFRFARIKVDVANQVIDNTFAGLMNPSYAYLRVPLLLVAGVLVIGGGLTTRFLANGMVTYTYESGARSCQGRLKNGRMHGDWAFYYEDGTMSCREIFSGGVLNGPASWWDEKGALVKRGNYKMGMSHGRWEYLHPGGQVLAAGDFQHERETGRWLYWHEDGQMSQECFYEHGQLDSIYRSWHPNGRQSTEGWYVHGKKHGVWREWDSTGRLVEELEYVNDTMRISNRWDHNGKHVVRDGNGTYVSYHANGSVAAKGPVVDGEKQGTWKNWYDNGAARSIEVHDGGKAKVLSCWSQLGERLVIDGNGTSLSHYDSVNVAIRGDYKDGLAHGEWKFYYPNGNLMRTVTYRGGVEQGDAKSYFLDGTISSEGSMAQGVQQGEWTWYHDNGQVSSKVTFDRGLKQGKQGFFDAFGNKTKVETYKDGEPVGEELLL